MGGNINLMKLLFPYLCEPWSQRSEISQDLPEGMQSPVKACSKAQKIELAVMLYRWFVSL